MSRDDDFDRPDDRDRDRDRYDDPPPRRRRDFDDDPDSGRRKVKPPAIAMLIVGVISLLFVGWGIYQIANFDRDFEAEKEKAFADPKLTEQDKKAMTGMMDTMKDVMKVAMPVGYGLQALTAVVMIIGSTQMMSLRSRGWGMAAALMALIPHMSCLPWLFGVAFGIWALVVLSNKDVKRAFAANKRGVSRRDEDDDRG